MKINIRDIAIWLLLCLSPFMSIGQCDNGIQCRVRVLVAIDPAWASGKTDATIIQQAEDMIATANTIIGQSIDPQTLSAGGSALIDYGLTLAGVEVFQADPFQSGSTNCPFTQNIASRLLCRMSNNDLPEFENWMNHYRADVGIIVRQLNTGVLGQAIQNGYSTSPFIVLPSLGGKILAHELGHVVGCVHGCGDLSGIKDQACGSAGEGYDGLTYRTLMCQSGQTIDFYSNTWRFVNNDPMKPMGDSKHNCACVVATNTPDLTCFNEPSAAKTQGPSMDVSFHLYADHRVLESYTIQPNPGTNYIVEPDAKFVIRTGDFVDLKAGFWAKEGGNFRARVKGCYPSDPNNVPDVFRTKSGNPTFSESLEPIAPFDFSIQPNPFQDNMLLKLEMLAERNVSIQVLNTQGQIVERILEQETLPIGPMERKIDTRQWAKGLYIIRVIGDGQILSRKVIKQ
ncbi:MAG: zinc-dependent metalloprotease [Bacteroidota bacterium]